MFPVSYLLLTVTSESLMYHFCSLTSSYSALSCYLFTVTLLILEEILLKAGLRLHQNYTINRR
jgi:hypothetical protein